MYFRIIAAFALSFVFYVGSGQDSYHRLYETTFNGPGGMNDTIFYHMSSTTISGDVYAMGTKRFGDGAMDFEDFSVIFTMHDAKGDLGWSRELDLGKDSVEIVGQGKIEFNSTLDSILFMIEVEINGDREQLFGRLDKSGGVLELDKVGGFENATVDRTPHAAPFINQSDILLTPGALPIISRLGQGDDLIWSREYDFLNSDSDPSLSFVTDIRTTQDSTIVLSGVGAGEEFVVAELDSNGVQIWAESYTFPIGSLVGIIPYEVEPLPSGNFAVVGSYGTAGGSQFNGFMAVIDTAGTIITAKKLFVQENATEISNLLVGADGTLWMSGTYASQDSVLYFTSNLNTDGTVNWTTIYPEQLAGFGPFTTSLIGVQGTGGATLVGHGFKDDLPVLSVMKHDAEGAAMCSDTTTITAEDLMIEADTLTTTVDNGGIFFDSLGFELSNFSGFTPPTLTITQYPAFCPNEFIDTFLVASVGGVAEENISYLWSTDETTDTIRITAQPMEMPEYSVTVTITEDVCYTMCDTVQITRLTLPQVAIGLDNSRYCDENLFVLSANYTPGAPNPTFIWSTGETEQFIEVTEPGQYSVTVTDECNEMANAQIEVSFPQAFELFLTESSNLLTFCNNNNSHRLDATAQGGVGSPVYSWSTGEVGTTIFVAEDGTYSVTATDECGDMLVESLSIIIKEEPTTGEISYELTCDEDNNELSQITFSATTNIENLEEAIVHLNIYNADDLDNAVSSQVIPSNSLPLGDYVAQLVICEGEIIAELAINAEALCGGLLRYPIAFFPGGQDEASQTFGPIPNDTMNVQAIITDVEFKVFNRWGETVFESNDILEAWDGTHKGDPAPSEVYIWYVSYIVEGVEMLDKGDVTLIR